MQKIRAQSCLMLVVLASLFTNCGSRCALAQSSNVAKAAGASQANPQQAAPEPEPESDALFVAWQGNTSVKVCGVCHYSPGNDFAKRGTDFCRLTELAQWLKTDRHATARQRVEPIAAEQRGPTLERTRRVLSNQVNTSLEIPESWVGESNFLSLAICRRLGYDIDTTAGYAQFRENCLTCHGGYDAVNTSDGFAQADANQPGITCNYCHQTGTSSLWIDEHSGVDAQSHWRTLSPAVKAEKGMRDLVSADAQADLCYRCHIGDIRHNMFVTHAMYAAGHPLLPSVELNTLVEAMPRHWRDPAELYRSLQTTPQRSAYFIANFPALTTMPQAQARVDRVPWRVDAMVGGALAAREQWLRLIAQAAEQTSNHWGDYALYDCSACHHELRLPSPRQALRSAGAPGRPRLLEWPQVLSRAVEQASGHGQELSSLNRNLTKSIDQRPFGDRKAVHDSASKLADALASWKQQLASQRLTEAFARQTLSALAQTPDELLLDYDSARQVNWAIRGIAAELEDSEQPLHARVSRAIAELGSGPTPEESRISLNLPVGRTETIYPAFVRVELQRRSAYDSKQFSRQLKAVAASLLSAP